MFRQPAPDARGDIHEPVLHERALSDRRGWLSQYARRKKLEYFFSGIPKDALILDVGCGEGWVRDWASAKGWSNIVGLDLRPPADIVGDIRDWKNLGLKANSFDYIIAFEVIEHGDFAAALNALLKPTGRLLATTPVPRFDWLCQLLENMAVLQPRVGPHTHLVDLREYEHFSVVDRRVKGLIAQWGILQPV